MGRPAFRVTAAMRRDVELMKADGFSDDRIAAQLSCSRPTLLKHFAKELEFGADKVRRQQLRNLDRMSKRNVAASKALLARSDTVAPPAPPTRPDDAPRPPPLGKKETADLEAQTAEAGTSWANLIKH